MDRIGSQSFSVLERLYSFRDQERISQFGLCGQYLHSCFDLRRPGYTGPREARLLGRFRGFLLTQLRATHVFSGGLRPRSPDFVNMRQVHLVPSFWRVSVPTCAFATSGKVSQAPGSKVDSAIQTNQPDFFIKCFLFGQSGSQEHVKGPIFRRFGSSKELVPAVILALAYVVGSSDISILAWFRSKISIYVKTVWVFHTTV
jgi:hypothetical protein